MLRAKMGPDSNPKDTKCFVRLSEQLGLGHAAFCKVHALGESPFAILLVYDFLTEYQPSVTSDLMNAFATTGKTQPSIWEVDGPNI